MSDDVTLGRVFGAFFTTGVTISAGGAAGLRCSSMPSACDRRWRSPAQCCRRPPLWPCVDYAGSTPAASPRVRRSACSPDPLLADLAPTTLEKLAARSSLTEVAPGEVVVTRGDEPDRFYVLVDGAAEVLSDGILLNRLVPGDHFGEIAVIGGGVRTATVRTTQPSLPAVDRGRRTSSTPSTATPAPSPSPPA